MSDDATGDLADDQPMQMAATIVQSAKVGRLTTKRGLILLIINEGMDTEASYVTTPEGARAIAGPLIREAAAEDKANRAVGRGVAASIVTPPKPRIILPN